MPTIRVPVLESIVTGTPVRSPESHFSMLDLSNSVEIAAHPLPPGMELEVRGKVVAMVRTIRD